MFSMWCDATAGRERLEDANAIAMEVLELRGQVEDLAQSQPGVQEGVEELRREMHRLSRQLLPGMLSTLGGRLDSLSVAMESLEGPHAELLRELRRARRDVLDAVEKRGVFDFMSPCL